MPGYNVNLFASRLTAVFPTYTSWKPDPGVSYIDAMTLDWAPPFSLIAPVLKKVSQDKADLVLVPPVWQAQPWQAPSDRLSHIREQRKTEGFLEDITEIVLSATRSSTHKTYQSAWGQWNSWYGKRKVNPVSATLNDVLLFLTDRLKSGTAYRSVN